MTPVPGPARRRPRCRANAYGAERYATAEAIGIAHDKEQVRSPSVLDLDAGSSDNSVLLINKLSTGEAADRVSAYACCSPIRELARSFGHARVR